MTSYLFSMILSNLPTMLVLLAGGVAAIVFMQRAQTAAFLTLAGVALMLIAIVVQMGINIGAIQPSELGSMLSRISKVSRVLFGLMEAVSLGLILAAVFVGRPQPAATSPQFPNNLK